MKIALMTDPTAKWICSFQDVSQFVFNIPIFPCIKVDGKVIRETDVQLVIDVSLCTK